MVDRRTVLRIAHDLGLAAWFGGAWMGAVALNGATIEVDDHTQRTRVASAGWFHWSPIAATAVLVHAMAAASLGRLGGVEGWASEGTVRLRRLRGAVLATAALATAETGVQGRRVAAAGDVPVATAVTPIAATPPRVAAAQRRLRVGQWVVPLATGALWVIDALQDRDNAAR